MEHEHYIADCDIFIARVTISLRDRNVSLRAVAFSYRRVPISNRTWDEILDNKIATRGTQLTVENVTKLSLHG